MHGTGVILGVMTFLHGRLLLAALATAAPAAYAAAPQQAENAPAAPATQGVPASSAPDDVAAILKDLTAAHRSGETAPLEPEGFVAKLAVTPEREGEHQVTVETDVRFRLEGPRIRYRANEGDRRLERGQDRRGKWLRIGDEVSNLADKDLEGDREQLKKDIRLARQLIRFLDPAAFAARLENAVAGHERLPGERAKTEYRTLSGTLDAFPLYAAAGEDHRAHVTLYVAPDTSLLRAVKAVPVDARSRAIGAGELYLMSDHREQDGLRLPTTIVFYRVDRGVPQPDAKVVIQQVDLAPELTEAMFDRDERW